MKDKGRAQHAAPLRTSDSQAADDFNALAAGPVEQLAGLLAGQLVMGQWIARPLLDMKAGGMSRLYEEIHQALIEALPHLDLVELGQMQEEIHDTEGGGA